MLLDRQHYRGPLWEGIGKPQSVLDDPNVLFYRPQYGPDAPTVDKFKKPGQQTFEEIDR
jgi:hypothetical protein